MLPTLHTSSHLISTESDYYLHFTDEFQEDALKD